MDGTLNVTAFKPGFRMLVGDASLRTQGTERKLCTRCMPSTGDNKNINCGAPDSQAFPSEPCPGGFRAVITFPTCWDGVNTDSPDHRSHVAYPTAKYDALGAGGNCPDTHPVQIPQVMYEVMWDVSLPRHLFAGPKKSSLIRFMPTIDPAIQRQEPVA
jgi:hypothetical protein